MSCDHQHEDSQSTLRGLALQAVLRGLPLCTTDELLLLTHGFVLLSHRRRDAEHGPGMVPGPVMTQ